jgi:DNA sulfur modification protein DndD
VGNNLGPKELLVGIYHGPRHLHLHTEKAAQFRNKLRRITEETALYEKDLTAIEQKLHEIDSNLQNYDASQIKEWHIERQKFEQIRDAAVKKVGQLEVRMKTVSYVARELKRKLEEELKKEQQIKELTKQIDFCEKAYAVTKQTKEQIMSETRERIRTETRDLFLQLVWKKETFKDVTIDEEYNLNLIHSIGYECLGTVGAAERQLLALSFTLALHRVSGFGASILVDTPVGRVSDRHRESFAKILADVATNKQVILLFTPDEYSANISNLLDSKCNDKYLLRMTADEKETKVEVLYNA